MKCREGRVKLEVRLAVNQGSVIPCPYRAAGPSLFARLPLLIPGSPSSSKFHCHSHVVETLIIVIALWITTSSLSRLHKWQKDKGFRLRWLSYRSLLSSSSNAVRWSNKLEPKKVDLVELKKTEGQSDSHRAATPMMALSSQYWANNATQNNASVVQGYRRHHRQHFRSEIAEIMNVKNRLRECQKELSLAEKKDLK